RHVANRHTDPVLKHLQVVEIISSGGFGRVRYSGDVKSGDSRGRFREQVLLDFSRHTELLMVFAQFLFGPLALRDVADESNQVRGAMQVNVGEANVDEDLVAALVQ